MAKTLDDLFQDTIKDIYSSETMLLNAMPKLSQAARDPELKAAIEKHARETQEHIDRIERIAKMLNFSPEGVTCQATVGLVKEASEHLEEYSGEDAGDAAIIASAQKNEHYEIASYGTVAAWADQLGYTEASMILRQTLAEEEATDQALSKLARGGVNQEAVQELTGQTHSSIQTGGAASVPA